MATVPKSGFEDMVSDIDGPDWGDDFGNEGSVTPVQSRRVEDLVFSPAQESNSMLQAEKLLDIRGFFVASGTGLYDGSAGGDEEMGESYFVDVQEYENGEIKRVWGVALGEVMAQAQAALGLQPGSRVHLVQRGKRDMVFDSVNANKEMVFRTSYANDWVCLPDRGPLPSQLAYLMAGINVDALLDRLALRNDMGADDPNLPAWKNGKLRIIKALGEDPQKIQTWFAGQMTFSGDDERTLISQALALEGFAPEQTAVWQRELEERVSALKSMDPTARFDYLIESARPHLLIANQEREKRLSHEVAESIDSLVRMAAPDAAPESSEHKAFRSALVQSIDGLTSAQQIDFLSSRRASLVQQLSVESKITDDAELDKTTIIDVTNLSNEEYRARLERKLAMATTGAERAAMLAAEMEARKKETVDAEARFAPINAFYQQITSSRDMDMTAFLAGRVAGMLADTISSNVIPGVKSMFERLGGVGGWRRSGCEDGLSDLRDALAVTKATPVYQAFETDPIVRAACPGLEPGQMLAQHPDTARTEVVQKHLLAQAAAESPSRSAPSPHKGLWAKTFDSAHALSDRISHLSPQHLLKNGTLDSEWIQKMQTGLSEFATDLCETLMPEKLRAQLQEMIAGILQTLKMLASMAKSLFAGQSSPAVASMDR